MSAPEFVRPGVWVDGLGWVARQGECPSGTYGDPAIIVTRWPDGTVPSDPLDTDQCGAESGYHDDGDWMDCTREVGHDGDHYCGPHGLAWAQGTRPADEEAPDKS